MATMMVMMPPMIIIMMTNPSNKYPANERT